MVIRKSTPNVMFSDTDDQVPPEGALDGDRKHLAILEEDGEIEAQVERLGFAQPSSLAPVTASTSIEQARAIASVQGMIIAAKASPRNMYTVAAQVIRECKRYGAAKEALYSYPRGGQNVVGPSIRLAEVLVRAFGNVDTGVVEVSRHPGYSEAEAYAWDLETNTRHVMRFTVPHERHKRGGVVEQLVDARDIYEEIANRGARRKRSCILNLIPGDLVELALTEVRKTLARGDGTKSLPERIRDLVLAFNEVGVPKEALEKRLGHPMEQTVAEEIPDMQAIYKAIKENFSSRDKFFDMGTAKSEGLAALNEELKKNPAK